MGGHIVVERLTCDNDIRVRVLVNEVVQKIPGCHEVGGEGIYDLNEFQKVIKGRWEKGFCETCAMTYTDCVDKISFFES